MLIVLNYLFQLGLEKLIFTNTDFSTYANTPTIFSNAACVYDGKFDKGLTSYGNIIEI